MVHGQNAIHESNDSTIDIFKEKMKRTKKLQNEIGQTTRLRSYPHVDGNYALHVYIPRSYLKEVDEITTLCDIQACVIIYTLDEPEPEVWPSNKGMKSVISKFLGEFLNWHKAIECCVNRNF
ncbi:hypothetical protein JHK85_000904 [Glycine max]|nr:hypothetical protein JHK85_000904 [Glycine max]